MLVYSNNKSAPKNPYFRKVEKSGFREVLIVLFVKNIIKCDYKC